jgi:hypothetical protein
MSDLLFPSEDFECPFSPGDLVIFSNVYLKLVNDQSGLGVSSPLMCFVEHDKERKQLFFLHQNGSIDEWEEASYMMYFVCFHLVARK